MTAKQRKRERQAARRARRAAGSGAPSIAPPTDEPCSCGGRYYTRREGGRFFLGHTPPVCDAIQAIDSESMADEYVYLQRRAQLATETPVYTVPWFEDIGCEMPGFIMHAVRQLMEVTLDIGLQRIDVYAAEFRRRGIDAPNESLARILYISEKLGIISRVEVPEGTVRGVVSSDLN